MTENADIIARNVSRVREEITAAAERSGRSANDVTLIAVTKYVDQAITELVIQAGCLDIGESRPQELWKKAASLAAIQAQTGFRWHLIGHLQRNKIHRTLPVAELIHSIDSERLLAALHAAAGETPVRGLLEVNVSGDPSKHGWQPADMPQVVENLTAYPQLEIVGLMTMASLTGDMTQARREFATLRELRDRLQPHCPPHCRLAELSMGMSRDFVVAVEEGATMVRVGTTLFEGAV